MLRLPTPRSSFCITDRWFTYQICTTNDDTRFVGPISSRTHAQQKNTTTTKTLFANAEPEQRRRKGPQGKKEAPGAIEGPEEEQEEEKGQEKRQGQG